MSLFPLHRTLNPFRPRALLPLFRSLVLVCAAMGITISCTSLPDPAPVGWPEPKPSQLPREWPHSPTLEKQWGAPRGPVLTVLGQAARIYNDPSGGGRYVQVSYLGGEATPVTAFGSNTPASDGQLTVMGRTVDYYGSGNEAAEISTQPVRLTSPRGWSGWFTFQFSCKEHLEGKNLPEFVW